MNGHPRLRRTPARPQHTPSRRRSTSPSMLLLAALIALLVAASALASGCGAEAEDTTTSTAAVATFPVTVTDDNGKSVTVKAEPVRIVSTAPASTETLFALGAGDRVVGVTSLDDYPPEVADITKIGDFQANTEAVMGLSPDLVVGYSGNEEALAPVEAAGAPVIIFNPATMDGIYANIATLGAVTGTAAEAVKLVDSIKAQVQEVVDATAATGDKPRVFYAVDNTLWTCGPGSFVDELIALVNAVNVGSETQGEGVQAYYQFSPEQLIASDPDVILLPNTAYTTTDEFTQDARFGALTAVKNGRVMVIDDILITRPGARVGQGLKVLAEAVHPGVF